ncbi:MAG: glutamine--tRNA ligase/YqeY domain fusion protein [Candidatus Fermentibacteraceae bacterium]|nr:glutamine--tRNA ligase/YqeY domain fusion protein [Candidatus Fermentibacteraceae bacterium]
MLSKRSNHHAGSKMTNDENGSLDFIREIVERDIKEGKHGGRIHTRFPPEPNGCIHIGHAKAICTDFGIAEEYGGLCNLRFDDTNPVKEDVEFVEAIKEDIRWLGYDWGNRLYFASDYFEQMYLYAEELIRKGVAYVCDLSAEEVRQYRGTLTEPGRNSPYRERSVDENLDLFRRMKAGEFPDGSRTLRARIDMSSPNINMRDPAIYRILRKSHHRTGDEWCIYPMYDYAHCLEDSIEGITHSFCSIEFEDHRPLYDWFLDQLGIFHPQQIEFARLNLTYTVMSKRKLAMIVEKGVVSGWDDPRMPTLSGLRRRGVTPEAVKDFLGRIGLAKRDSTVDMALLEYCIRDDLNRRCMRLMGVLDPLKVTIENYPEDRTETLEFTNNPEDESAGTRSVPFSREIYIERDDFQEEPHRKFKRLVPGGEVRLRYAYYIRCVGLEKDEDGTVTGLVCTYDPATRGGDSPDGRKVSGTIHWVSARHAVNARVILYDRLFSVENPLSVDDFIGTINDDSLEILDGCMLEPAAADMEVGVPVQCERKGYFCKDPGTAGGRTVWNRTVALRDTWKKILRNED